MSASSHHSKTHALLRLRMVVAAALLNQKTYSQAHVDVHWADCIRGAPLGTPSPATNSVPLSLVLFPWGAWEAGHVNYRPGADRCSVAGTGVGAGSLIILAGVLVHRATRPLRGSVSRGSGWSVPCVSIQLTLSQGSKTVTLHASVCRFRSDQSGVSRVWWPGQCPV